jgi:hypothetical protein
MLDNAWIERRLAGLSEAGMTRGETRAMHASGYDDLADAISRIPKELKSSLEEAFSRCPSLVESESDPIRFLRREEFNGWAAALRLMEYWTTRRTIFADKAFRPMTLSSDGALEETDRVLLRTGAMCILPENRNGRMVRLWLLHGRSNSVDVLGFVSCADSLHDAGRTNRSIDKDQRRHSQFECEG